MSLFFIFISFSSAGIFLSKKIELRIHKLEKVYILFSDISSRIEFTAQCIGDIFSDLSEDKSYEILPFVKSSFKYLSQGEDFDIAWEKSLHQYENVHGLKREDITVLLSFGSNFGKSDVSGQMSNCEIHKRLTEAKLISAREECNMYSKPLKGIGVLAGIASVILLS